MIQTLRNLPPVRWASVHPRLAAWIVLSAGMVILLIIEAANVGLLIGQWIALIVACVLVAGACVWIISWEDADDVALDSGTTEPSPEPAPVVSASVDTEPEASATR
jgi:hypothetical protein